MLKLILILINLPVISQDKFIGSVERLSPEIDNLIEKSAKIEILADGFEWSEGPVWSSQLNSVLFSDVPENVIYIWNEDKGLGTFTRPIGYSGKVPNLKKAGTNGLTIDADGNLIICMHGDRKITRLEKLNINRKVTLVNSFDGNLLNSPNDLVYDSKGNLYFTDPPYGLLEGDNDKLKEIEFNGVYKVSPNGDIEVLRAFPPTNNTGGATPNNNNANDFSRPDAVYLRLKTLNVSYNLPKSLTNRLGIDNAQIYVGGSNLLTFDNLGLFSGEHDPEITGANDRDYPNVKTVTTGVRIGF